MLTYSSASGTHGPSRPRLPMSKPRKRLPTLRHPHASRKPGFDPMRRQGADGPRVERGAVRVGAGEVVVVHPAGQHVLVPCDLAGPDDRRDDRVVARLVEEDLIIQCAYNSSYNFPYK